MRVVPQRLTEAGFAFRHADLDSAVGWLLDGNDRAGSA
jgi:NAD dependent epimerase/dehydratase family enzyme